MEERIMSKLFISGGTVIDPETLTRFSADVLCEDGRIAAIYKEPANAPKDAQVLDASGCFVCPGFIDPHGHIDGCKRTGMLSLLQGITTTVGGNCGFSPLDTGAFLRSQTEFPIHQAELVGLCALREAAGVTDLFAPARRAQVHTDGNPLRTRAAGRRGGRFPWARAMRRARRWRKWKPSVRWRANTAAPPPSTRACTP